MNTYLYDGTFDGLLSVYFYAYLCPEIYAICRQEAYQPDLLSTPLVITTEQEKADRIYNSIQQKLSATVLRNLYLLYLSEVPYCDLLGLQYLRLCYKKGAKIQQAKQHPLIHQVDAIRYKVLKELDHMKGFLRLEELAPKFFYACFSPDHNQLPLLAPHLQKRFSDQSMIIHDVKRKQAWFYHQQYGQFLAFTQQDADALHSQSTKDSYLDLFRNYYQSITIPERENLRLQAQYMPHRYRLYMGETQSSD